VSDIQPLNFYNVEKWTKDGAKVDRMLFAGSNLDKAERYSSAGVAAVAEVKDAVPHCAIETFLSARCVISLCAYASPTVRLE
jgi:hypothetical protein